MSEDVLKQAERFLEEEKAFRLGCLETESSHPKTRELSFVAQNNLGEAIRQLQSVDAEIPPVALKVFRQDVFQQLVEAFLGAIQKGRRIYFTGCGSTGRLSILLEAMWRKFWQRFKENSPESANRVPDREDAVISVMAGGDFALIKAVEGFEDFPAFGRYQLQEAGVQKDDVVVAITEGGETFFVIGTAWEGLETGAHTFFVFNNAAEQLREHVQRSREVVEEDRIHKIDLTTGPMAITGSTRMQATTIELLIVGAALETALVQYLRGHSIVEGENGLPLAPASPEDYHHEYQRLFAEFSSAGSVEALARLTEYEERIYRKHGLITYLTDDFLLDVLTDTTERSPTFMLPPFRRIDDTLAPVSWAFVKDPFRSTQSAWHALLGRSPRGLRWGKDTYREINAPADLQRMPPRLDNEEIYKFPIGREADASRTETADSVLCLIGVGEDTGRLIETGLSSFAGDYRRTALLVIGAEAPHDFPGEVFHFPVKLSDTPLKMWHHLAIKLILNTVSTATMVRMDRVIGNTMVWLSPSNKKLIDRGSRLIMGHCGCSYEDACRALFVAIEEVERRSQQGEEVPSPVALALERLQEQNE